MLQKWLIRKPKAPKEGDDRRSREHGEGSGRAERGEESRHAEHRRGSSHAERGQGSRHPERGEAGGRTERSGGGRERHGKTSSRNTRAEIAATTLEAIDKGSYGQYDIRQSVQHSKHNTQYHGPYSPLSAWATAQPSTTYASRISLLEISTLEGARLLASSHPTNSDGSDARPKIGVLNFASAKHPGGGFLSGASAQEESIARSSTLYPTLMTATAQQFYTAHNRDAKHGYYSHAMIYSPAVLLIRDDRGAWLEPLAVDVLTSPAVNAGTVRQYQREKGEDVDETPIVLVMKERMARLLYLFEKEGARDLVLGSFGTGVFRNDVATVAALWAELLLAPGARFSQSFGNIVFAVLGGDTFSKFQDVLAPYGIS